MSADMGHLHDRRCAGQRGVALLEFALLFPALAFIVMGTIDLGRAYVTTVQLRNAAREGAVYARMDPYKQADDGSGNCTAPNNVSYHAQAENGGGALTVMVAVAGVTGTPNGTGCDVTDVPPASTPGSPVVVTVTASTTFTPITPFVSTLIGSAPTISASVSTTAEH